MSPFMLLSERVLNTIINHEHTPTCRRSACFRFIFIKPISQKTFQDLIPAYGSFSHSFLRLHSTRIHAIYNAQQHNHLRFRLLAFDLHKIMLWRVVHFRFLSLPSPNTVSWALSFDRLEFSIIHSRYLGAIVHTIKIMHDFIYSLSLSTYIYLGKRFMRA